jgi:hypothetical protein
MLNKIILNIAYFILLHFIADLTHFEKLQEHMTHTYEVCPDNFRKIAI